MLPASALLFSSLIWAFSYFPIEWLYGDHVSAASLVVLRFLGAGAVMLAVRPRAVRLLGRRELLGGVLLGVLLGLGTLLQLEGLTVISPAVSGFVTTLYVIFTPLVAWAALRRRIGRANWIAVALALVGAGVLSLHGVTVDRGVLLTTAGSLGYACHFVALSELSVREHVYGLTVVQLLVGGGLAAGWAAAGGGVDLPHTGANWGWLVFCVLGATMVTFWLQAWAQEKVSATRTAVLLTSEPIYVVGFTAALGGTVATRSLVGGAMILAAVVVVEIDGVRRRRAPATPAPALVPAVPATSVG